MGNLTMTPHAASGRNVHIEVDLANHPKNGQQIAGDVFLSRRVRGEDRVVSVLSDGLGSGVKASVLATLTSTMAIEYASRLDDIRTSAETIMDTLPVCRVRKISYSTFSIADVSATGKTRVIEHGNPPFILLRQGRVAPVTSETLSLERWQDRPLTSSHFQLALGDRIVLYSDGVSQSGMGQPGMPLGWGAEEVSRFVEGLLAKDPEMSARKLALKVVKRALRNDAGKAKDDISCAVISFRRPRGLLILTGPPFARSRDGELADLVRSHPWRKVICGGTTASIVARQLERMVTIDLEDFDPELPPASKMEGVDLVTEGTLTLARVVELIDGGIEPLPTNPAGQLLNIMLESDRIEFVVGTRINEAHQDPNIPVELDLRRNIVKRLARLLEKKHLKQVSMRLI